MSWPVIATFILTSAALWPWSLWRDWRGRVFLKSTLCLVARQSIHFRKNDRRNDKKTVLSRPRQSTWMPDARTSLAMVASSRTPASEAAAWSRWFYCPVELLYGRNGTDFTFCSISATDVVSRIGYCHFCTFAGHCGAVPVLTTLPPGAVIHMTLR